MTRLDLLLLLMIAIWGTNFSLVKVAMRDFPELAFNAARLVVASTVFLAAMYFTHQAPTRVSRRDWTRLIILGIVGTCLYQLCFLGGVKRTSVGNSSLITGSSPIVIALAAAVMGHEHIRPFRWMGVGLAMLGLYFVVGHRVQLTPESRLGDLLMILSMLCWATYSVAAQPLLKVHSPLIVTGVSFISGSVLYVLVTLPTLVTISWAAISVSSWIAMLVSGTLALSLSYLIWYTAIQRLGTTRTSVYSYLTPVVAMLVATVWLGEPIESNQVFGAGTILAGLVLTRLAHGQD